MRQPSLYDHLGSRGQGVGLVLFCHRQQLKRPLMKMKLRMVIAVLECFRLVSSATRAGRPLVRCIRTSSSSRKSSVPSSQPITCAIHDIGNLHNAVF